MTSPDLSPSDPRAPAAPGENTRGEGLLFRYRHLLLGMLFVAAYFQVALRNSFFLPPHYSYVSNPAYLIGIPAEQLASCLWKVILLLPAAVFLALFWSKVGRPWDPGRIASGKAVVPAIAAVALVVLIFTIVFVLQKTEVTDDELTYELQAKILLTHKLYVQPPVPSSFGNVFVLPGEKFTGKYTIGHPVVLALGGLMGSQYIFPVIFAVLLVPLCWAIAKRLYGDQKLAVLSAGLLAVSPFFYFTSATRLSHTTSAFFLLLFVLLFLKTENVDSPGSAIWLLSFLGGLAAGFAFNVRPWTAVAFLFPFLVLAVADTVRQGKAAWPRLGLFAAGFAGPAAFALFYNRLITGAMFTFPFIAYNPGERLFGPLFRAPQAAMNLLNNLLKMNAFLFGFPLSLLFAFLLVVKPVNTRGDRLLFAVVASFAVFHVAYYSPGVSDTGPVYYFELLVPLVILSARGIQWASGFIRRIWPRWDSFVPRFVVISVILSAMTFGFERSLHLIGLTTAIKEPYAAVQAAGLRNAVVFIKSWPNKGFVYGYRNNSPDFNDDVLYCRLLHGDQNVRVAERYAGRRFFVLEYDAAAGRTQLTEVSREQLASY